MKILQWKKERLYGILNNEEDDFSDLCISSSQEINTLTLQQVIELVRKVSVAES